VPFVVSENFFIQIPARSGMPESGELIPNLCLDRGMMGSEEDDHVMLMVPMEDGSYVPVIDGRVDGSLSMISLFLEASSWKVSWNELVAPWSAAAAAAIN
jgi:hypothetical protein